MGNSLKRAAEIAHLAPKVVEAYQSQTASVKDIAKSLGVSTVWAYEQIQKAGILPDWRIAGRQWMDRQERDESVLSLREQGYSINLICRLLDMRRSSVYSILRRYGKTNAREASIANLQKRKQPTQ